MFTQRRPGGGENHEVNLTPLIDVSLVLVVILLLATPLAFQSSIGLRSARASGRQAEEQAPETRIEVTVVSEDSLRVNRRLVARADLGPHLAPLLAASTDGTVIVTCADRVSHGTFVAVVDEAKHLGARNIALVGR